MRRSQGTPSALAGALHGSAQRAREQTEHEVIVGEQQRPAVGHMEQSDAETGLRGADGDLLKLGLDDAGPVALGCVEHRPRRLSEGVFQEILQPRFIGDAQPARRLI